MTQATVFFDANVSETSPTPLHTLESEADVLRLRYTTILKSAHEAARDCGRNPDEVRVIAVSKTQPLTTIQAALAAEIPALGENYAQEFKEKASALAVDASATEAARTEWHFIGHLQTNKVKMVVPFATWIHSVDSVRLAQEISKVAAAHGRTVNVLLQVNTSGEESKSGCEPDEITALAESAFSLPNLRVRGLMTIAAFSDDAEFVRPMFRLLRSLRDDVRSRFPEASAAHGFSDLSMGMTNDYAAAIQEGATMIRVGTAIFGERHDNTQ